MTDPLLVIARYVARAGEADTVRALLAELATASRSEEGNVSYEATQDVLAPERFVIVEVYVDDDAFAAHRASEHFQRLGFGEIIPRLESRVVQTFSGATRA
ncbi:putative quinol monooxygenase [Microbacterium sp. 179-I 3D2 NHS]|uniref:putative quinol monooxygenase n=1 Tax=Microbacterium sp. 179-I 3D2 NHS TaxID=3235178 RepID=UPI0039A31752